MKIDICLAVLDKLDYTKKFVDSLFKSTNSDFDLIITNNGSKEETCSWLSSLKENNIKVINFEYNLGCAIGWNVALKNGVNDYRVLTQNDIQFSKNWDLPLLDFLENNKEFMAAGSMEIENLDMSQEEMDNLSEKFKTGIIGYDRFYVPCMMIKKEVFDIVGYFDENFKTGTYEDSDFINRCVNADVRFAQVHDSIVCHVWGQTSRIHANVHYNKKYFEKKWKDKEVKNVDMGYNFPESPLINLYDVNSGKIREEVIKEEMEKLNIPFRKVR